MYVRPVGPNVASYYLRQGAGLWVGTGIAHLGVDGEVCGHDLRAALLGRDPASGRFLPEVRRARRRAGWDLVFAAPKSLSILATPRTAIGERIASAQRAAVAEALSHFEGGLLHVRRDGRRVPSTSGAVAAEFDHSSNAGGEPHLHTHLLLLNLARDPAGAWSSIGGWWLERRELDAIYVLGLRHHLAAKGVDVEWRMRPDGLVDVAGVPRAALRATSTRTRDALEGRRHAGRTSNPNRPWRQRALSEGWKVPTTAIPQPTSTSTRPDLSATVTTRLALKGSTFGRRDVLLALGACPEARFTSGEARQWVDEFLSRCRQVPPRHQTQRVACCRLWTTELAETADRMLEDTVRERIRNRRHSQHLDPPAADDAQERVSRLLHDRPVVVLASQARKSSFLSHTAVAARCAELCVSEGMNVAVSARSPGDSLRWETLTGIPGFRPSHGADVLFIDQADRRTSAELSVIIRSAGQARIVLVEGGTSMRLANPASLVLSTHSDVLARVDPGLPEAWDVDESAVAHPAMRMLRRWGQVMSAAAGEPAMLVALGVPETQELNDAARRHLDGIGRLSGPELIVKGRGFRGGDRVIAVRPLRSGLPAGTLGTVHAVDIAGSRAVIRWPHADATVDRATLARIGHGYATTPRLASRCNLPSLVLGPEVGIGLERSRVMESFSARGFEGRSRDLERSSP